MADEIGTMDHELTENQATAEVNVDTRVKEALKRLSELRKDLPPIDGEVLIREGREMADKGPRG
jgi:hypothetical protein